MQTHKDVNYMVGEKIAGDVIPIAIDNNGKCAFIDICYSEVNQDEPDHAEVLIGFNIAGKFCEIVDAEARLSEVYPEISVKIHEILIKIAEEKGLY